MVKCTHVQWTCACVFFSFFRGGGVLCSVSRGLVPKLCNALLQFLAKDPMGPTQ